MLNTKNDTIETVQLNNKRETKIPLIVETDVIVDLLEDIDPASLSSKVTINSNIDLPVSKGEVLGTLAYYNGEQLLTSVPLVSLDDFAGEDLVTELTNFFVTDQRPIFSKSWFIYLFIRLIIALLLWRTSYDTHSSSRA